MRAVDSDAPFPVAVNAIQDEARLVVGVVQDLLEGDDAHAMTLATTAGPELLLLVVVGQYARGHGRSG